MALLQYFGEGLDDLGELIYEGLNTLTDALFGPANPGETPAQRQARLDMRNRVIQRGKDQAAAAAAAAEAARSDSSSTGRPGPGVALGFTGNSSPLLQERRAARADGLMGADGVELVGDRDLGGDDRDAFAVDIG